jgi:hypothetical protein
MRHLERLNPYNQGHPVNHQQHRAMTKPSDALIPLTDTIAQLREALITAQAQGTDAPLRFEIQDIELELNVVTTKEAGGGGGVKFWVYNADAQVKASDARTQRVKLKLRPVNAEGEEGPVKIGANRVRPE